MFSVSGRYLSASEATELADRLAEVTQANIPLVEGLRAAADEVTNRRVKNGLLRLADEIQLGRPIDESVPRSVRVPAYLAGLLQAGIRSGSLSEVLSELADHYRASRDSWRLIWMALTYPVSLLALLAVVSWMMLMLVVPQMSAVFEDFETNLPATTASLIWFSRTGWKYFAGAALAGMLACVFIRVFGGASRWMRLVGSIPVFGGLFLWHGFAEFAHLLRLLLVQDMPLPAALRLTSGAVRNASVAQTTNNLANRIDRGQSLADGMNDETLVPAHLVSIVRVGEQNGELPSALQAIVELLEGHISLRSQLLISVLPPVLFVGIAGFTLLLLFALLSPLVSLISNLA